MEYSPIVVGDRLYGIDNNGEAFALKHGSGKQRLAPRRRHAERLGADLQRRPALHLEPRARPGPGPERAEREGRLAELRFRAARSPPRSSSDDKVIAGCECGSVYAFDKRTGKELWSTSVGGAVKASPAFDNGTVFVGDYGGQMTALRASNGSCVWTASAGGQHLRHRRGRLRPRLRRRSERRLPRLRRADTAARPGRTSTGGYVYSARRRPRRRPAPRRPSTSAPTTAPSTRSTPSPAACAGRRSRRAGLGRGQHGRRRLLRRRSEDDPDLWASAPATARSSSHPATAPTTP